MQELLKTLDILISKIENIKVPQPLECYSVKEVAKIIKGSENSVYNMIQTGVLKAFTIGVNNSKKPQYRISRKILEDYMYHNSGVPYEK